MITKVEHTVDDDGTIVKRRVYHRAGNVTIDGVLYRDEKFAWDHPYEDKVNCDACTKGVIPADVKSTKRVVVR